MLRPADAVVAARPWAAAPAAGNRLCARNVCSYVVADHRTLVAVGIAEHKRAARAADDVSFLRRCAADNVVRHTGFHYDIRSRLIGDRFCARNVNADQIADDTCVIAPGIDVHPFVSADNVTLARLRAADRCMECPIGNKYTVDIRHGLLTGQIHACQVAGYDAVPAADADAVPSVAAGNVALSNRACTDVPIPADLAVIAAYLNSGQREVIDLQTHYGEMRSLHFDSIAFLLIGAVQNYASVARVYRYI